MLINGTVLDQISNIEVNDVNVENIKELTNILNDNSKIGGISNILPLDLEIDQLREDIYNQRNRERERRG